MANGNGELLDFRPVPAKEAVKPSVDPEMIKAMVSEAIQTYSQNVLQAVQTTATQAVHNAMAQHKASRDSQLNAAFTAIAKILSVRFILLLAVIGGFTLAILVIQAPTVPSALVLAGYVVSTVWPLVYLDLGTRRRVEASAV